VKEESMTEQETRALEVRQEDIDNGTPNSASRCPFALAARRLFPGWDHVSVAPWRTGMNVELHNWQAGAFERWNLDAEGTAAVLCYDAGASMVPGTYTLTLDERRN
jgi:hypothetical protein